MRKAFGGSLCWYGLRGGAVYIENGCVVYKNQSGMLPAEYSNLSVTIADISAIGLGFILFLPTVELFLRDGRKYKFVIFNRPRFMREMQNAGLVINKA